MDVNDVLIMTAFSGNGSGGGGGSSDFSICKVTLSNENLALDSFYLIAIYQDEMRSYEAITFDGDRVLDCVLYKGVQQIDVTEDVVVSGNAVYDSDTGLVTVSGDCVLKSHPWY